MKNNSNARLSNDDNSIKISTLEKIIINWATPFEAPVIAILLPPLVKLRMIDYKMKYKEYFEKYGIIIGMYKQKVDDYNRLITYADEGDKVYSAAVPLYTDTPCGWVMLGTYNLLRKRRKYTPLKVVE